MNRVWQGVLPVLLIASAGAAETRLIGLDSGVYCHREGDAIRGVACDVMAAIAQRAGHSGKMDLLPMKRARETLTGTGLAFFSTPLGKDGNVEKVLDMDMKIIDEGYYFFATKDSKVDVKSLDALKALKVGVQLGAPSQIIAKQQGFTEFAEVSAEGMNLLKLIEGRIDVWLTTEHGAKSSLKAAGISLDKLRRGALLTPLPLYIGASKEVPPDEYRRFKAAFEGMQKDGTYQQILRKYDF
jgi:polar amino acid transport system substrate-binding protein